MYVYVHIYIYIYYIYIYIYICVHEPSCIHPIYGARFRSQGAQPLKVLARGGATRIMANLRTKILDFRGFYSSRILVLRGGIPGNAGTSPLLAELHPSKR